MEDITKGTTVVHKDPQGPRGKGMVTSADQWSVRVKWDSGRSGVYHPRILIAVAGEEQRKRTKWHMKRCRGHKK